VKELRYLIYKAGVQWLTGPSNPTIGLVHFDSRKVGIGDLFVAVKGSVSDGHNFIEKAVELGVSAIVCEDLPEILNEDVTYVKVKDSAKALGMIASNYYDNPSQSIHLVGVTGTNGKTTTVTLLYKIFTQMGFGCGLISTIRYLVMDKEYPSSHTTPDPLQINKMLRELADEGGTYCFMEVSSHAVVQQRIAGLTFKGGIFTNITHDHLDYHGTFKDYIAAKKGFFDSLGKDSFALYNADDPKGKVMVQNSKATIKSYGLRMMTDFRCKMIENHLEGLHLHMDEQELFCRLTGEFNAYNLTAVYATAVLLGQPKENVLVSISRMEAVDGRFETFRSSDGITAIVDYAHTPDALKNVLDTITSIRTRNEQLITVVGAGGDRDRLKRPVMARICAEKSDRVILTSDNPRSEDPEEIIAEMKAGIPADQMRKLMIIVNRREAIRAACNQARPGDIILVAGKGHEKYQEIKGVRYPFDDKEILGELLSAHNEIK
jgi:UDP-N-acetylmuramoyl-L-alanyl-D-glutamate--2,6-diaminopimelate ligase